MSARKCFFVLLSLLVLVDAGAASPEPLQCGVFSLKAAARLADAQNEGPGSAAFFDNDQRIAIARSLGLRYVRVNVDLNRRLPADEIAALRQAGLHLVLHVTTRERGAAAPPVTDLKAYGAELGQLLDQVRPDILAVENEEVAPNFFSGTADEYLAELRTAIEVAHERGIKVANGGITSHALGDLVPGLSHAGGRHGRAVATRDAKASDLLAAYRNLPLDYVNFHWYRPDPADLDAAVRYLRAATGKPVISTEMGQYDSAPETVTGLIGESGRLGIPLVIWFNGDGNRAIAATNADGSLRPAGEALRVACAKP
ncbi:MAG: hypothetical protein JSR19_06270 [Proteobacteria bacterium]|nr:hypothetical protein [Pseudomonadota bacterium]HQR04776.1 hypothetical protein [Rhodocyclaceae bacterium]